MRKINILFISVLITSTVIVITSTNWMGMWAGLEVNLMAFIPLIKTKKMQSSTSMMLYFLVQSLGSLMFMFSVTASHLTTDPSGSTDSITNTVLTLSMMTKLGAAPMHAWLPETMKNMRWFSSGTLMTWQKLAPMWVTSHILTDSKMATIAVLASVITGAIGGINQTSLMKILAYSSISHLGWMLSLMYWSNTWKLYLMVYSVMIIALCFTFSHLNIYFLPQMVTNLTYGSKMITSIHLMSLGGLPPFLGFLPKWMAISTLVENNMIVITIIMCVMSLITLFYYIRMVSPILMLNPSIKKTNLSPQSPMIMPTVFMTVALPVFLVLQ
uniref:NADH-ubiquinone oxidoreductase chain 2 n=1 Tax=Aradus compar TaxID=1176475 RepID=A0A172DYU8_9HEMI|nr:NADH dehydrogenase subunit 2 [Aradus compar]AFI54695.1 NADH dehydrogenase subunit 2 [Aradus compar]